MRIAFVSLMGGLPWGGSEALWSAIAHYAIEQGDSVLISVYDWGKLPKKIEELKTKDAIVLLRQLYKPETNLVRKVLLFIRNRKPTLNKDYQSIIDFKPERVFISQGDTFDLAIHHKGLYKLLNQEKIPFSLVCHSHQQYAYIPPQEIYPGAVDVFKSADFVYFISKKQWHLTERRLVSKLHNGRFTWNPINITIPEKVDNLPISKEIQMAMVGNLSGFKGHDTAFEVLSSDIWKDRNWILNIYGKGEGEKYLMDLASFYGINNRVIFRGFTDDIKKIWAINHLLLIPSAGEGMPLSMVEAMFSSRIVVSTEVGGINEVLIDSVNGFLAESPSTFSFSSALENCWKMKNEWPKIAEEAFYTIRKSYYRFPHIKIYEEIKLRNLKN